MFRVWTVKHLRIFNRNVKEVIAELMGADPTELRRVSGDRQPASHHQPSLISIKCLWRGRQSGSKSLGGWEGGKEIRDHRTLGVRAGTLQSAGSPGTGRSLAYKMEAIITVPETRLINTDRGNSAWWNTSLTQTFNYIHTSVIYSDYLIKTE